MSALHSVPKPIPNYRPLLRYSPLLLVLFGLTAHGEDKVLPTVNVSATVASRPDLEADSPLNPYRVPLSNRAGVETFTAEDIVALKPLGMFDLLDKATGMTVTYQGRKNPYFVKERGGGSFTYILDGAVLPTVTQRILQKIPLDAIEELQVVRDSTALTLGPVVNIGASGTGSGLNTGFIIIRTKQPKKDELHLRAAIEKADEQPMANKESLYGGKRFGDDGSVGVNGFIGGFVSHNDRPSKQEWFDGQNADAQMITGGINVGLLRLSVMGYQDSGRFEMQRGKEGLASASTNQMKWYYDPIDTSILAMNGSLAWNAQHTTLFTLFETKFTQTENDTNFPPYSATIKAADSFSNYWEKTDGFSLRHTMKFGGTTIQLGGQHTRSWALGSSGPTPNTRWDTEVNGLAATVEQRLLDDKLSLDFGVRRDKKTNTSVTTTAVNSNTSMPAADALSLGGRWQVMPKLALNGRYFNGDQGTVGDFNIRSQTGSLHPERQKRMEFGAEAKLMPEFVPTLTWFDVKINNQKSATSTTYTLGGATYYYYTETDNRRTGLELAAKGTLGERTHYKASWTHLTRNVSSNASVAKTNANNLYDLSVQHGWGPYSANVSIKHVGAYDGGGPGAAGAGGSFAADQQWHTIGDYTRLDANVSREFLLGATRLKGTLYGRNLGNVHYMTIFPWPDRGRTIGVEIGVDL